MADFYDIRDDYLLQLWKEGDERAFAAFYKRHYIQMVKAAYKKLGSRELAEEIAQDTMVALYYSQSIKDNPVLFCHQVLKNKIIDRYRINKVVLDSISDAVLSHSTKNHPLEYSELQDQLASLVRNLPEQARAVFLLRREASLSNQEIALRLGISVNTVERHMTKALAILKGKLDRAVYVGMIVGLYL